MNVSVVEAPRVTGSLRCNACDSSNHERGIVRVLLVMVTPVWFVVVTGLFVSVRSVSVVFVSTSSSSTSSPTNKDRDVFVMYS